MNCEQYCEYIYLCLYTYDARWRRRISRSQLSPRGVAVDGLNLKWTDVQNNAGVRLFVFQIGK